MEIEDNSTCSSSSQSETPELSHISYNELLSKPFQPLSTPQTREISPSYTFHSIESDLPKIKKAGRKICTDTIVLRNFFKIKGKGNPKKEYLRCQLIRGHKRIIRNLIKDSIPKKTLNSMNISKESFDTWDKLKKCYTKHQETLKIVCQTTEGPKTEGQKKRKLDECKNLKKSFNNDFCKEYFKTPEVRESYQRYVDYLFTDPNPNVLCKKFNFKCCQLEEHCEVCTKKWDMLRYYICNQMLNDLGVKPWEYRDVMEISPEQKEVKEKIEIMSSCAGFEFRTAQLQVLEYSKIISLNQEISNPSWMNKIYINRNTILN